MELDDMDEYGTEKHFGRNSQNSQYYGESSHYRESLGKRVMDSFRRDPRMMLTPKGTLAGDGKVFDVETAAQNTANSPLARKLKGRHLQMIAIGGSIGTFSCNFRGLPAMLIGHQVLVFSWGPAKPSPTVVQRVL
jgi:yeast amino acid transporter